MPCTKPLPPGKRPGTKKPSTPLGNSPQAASESGSKRCTPVADKQRWASYYRKWSQEVDATFQLILDHRRPIDCPDAADNVDCISIRDYPNAAFSECSIYLLSSGPGFPIGLKWLRTRETKARDVLSLQIARTASASLRLGTALGRTKVGIWVEIGVSKECEICFAA